MILYRNTDVDVPFFWSSDRQPSARWHGPGEGPVQYTSTSPDAAWAEFLRHADITDLADLDGIERTMWAVEIDDAEPAVVITLDLAIATGDLSTYVDCQAEARRLRRTGATRILAPCAARAPLSPVGWHSAPELHPGPPDHDATVALVGARPDQLGHMTSTVGRPHPSILATVRHL